MPLHEGSCRNLFPSIFFLHYLIGSRQNILSLVVVVTVFLYDDAIYHKIFMTYKIDLFGHKRCKFTFEYGEWCKHRVKTRDGVIMLVSEEAEAFDRVSFKIEFHKLDGWNNEFPDTFTLGRELWNDHYRDRKPNVKLERDEDVTLSDQPYRKMSITYELEEEENRRRLN
jgi:hypothetical protein